MFLITAQRKSIFEGKNFGTGKLLNPEALETYLTEIYVQGNTFPGQTGQRLPYIILLPSDVA